jgi:hypothetical protein
VYYISFMYILANSLHDNATDMVPLVFLSFLLFVYSLFNDAGIN